MGQGNAVVKNNGGDDRSGTLSELVQEETGASPSNCYQCGRCAAGCLQNVPGEMDISPTWIMHLLQLEAAFSERPELAARYAAQALTAETPWLCVGCQACTTRCPQGVDIAGTMDVLRQEGLRRRTTARTKRVRNIQALHSVFLSSALRHGRIHELFLVIGYKLRTGQFLQDAMLGPVMFMKGKLHVLPCKSPNTKRVRQAITKLKKP
ncbi:MAG: 4Fe-4S dicluster domain-containing protein [Verrucomicrobiia bacterium]